MPASATAKPIEAKPENTNRAPRFFDHEALLGNKTASRMSTKRHGTAAVARAALSSQATDRFTRPGRSDAGESTTAHSDTFDTAGDAPSRAPDSGNKQEPGRTIETSIWDWDAPSAPARDTPGHYYEPQGELIQEQRYDRPPRFDFTIPCPVGRSAGTWPISSKSDDWNEARGSRVSTAISAGVKRKSAADQAGRRASRTLSGTVEEERPSVDVRSPVHYTRSQAMASPRLKSGTNVTDDSLEEQDIEADPSQSSLVSESGAELRRTQTEPELSMVLPARKVFPIQIGDRLFRLSGASISSDAPSYFSQFFEEQLRLSEGADNVRTLYIDRDPSTFADIALHLQGYHIEPRDGPHFVKLFADAQFFSLPRLTAQLFASPIYIRIGDEEFQIPRDLFNNPGDTPNYFSLGFSTFFTSPSDAFPGLAQRALLRPPSILPPGIPHKSAKTFADLLHILKGYPVEIRNDEHREELLRDARYFHLKGLEQRLIPHEISYNLARERREIVLRLEDIRQSGVSFVPDSAPTGSTPPSSTPTNSPSEPGWIFYRRPFADTESYSLIVEIKGDESTFLTIEPAYRSPTARMCHARFFKQALSRITSLFSVTATKIHRHTTSTLGVMTSERSASATSATSLPVSPTNTGITDNRVKCRIGQDADVLLNGKPWRLGEDEDEDEGPVDVDPSRPPRAGSKRKKQEGGEEEGDEWIVRKAQWRLRVQPTNDGAQGGRNGMEIILGAVKIEAFSHERGRNATRDFLS